LRRDRKKAIALLDSRCEHSQVSVPGGRVGPPSSNPGNSFHAAPRYDEVVEEGQVAFMSYLSHPRAYPNIIHAWPRVAARMIVHQNEAGRSQCVTVPEYLPRVYGAGRGITSGNRIDGEEIKLVINKKSEQPFLILVGKTLHVGPYI
jgi:hypothetical protein